MEEVLDSAKFPVYKAIIESTDTAMVKRCFDLASEKFGDRFSIEMSGVATLEICPKGSSKGKMAKKLIALLERERGEKFKKVICVGDNQNDIDLVKLGDIGYAVGNAIDALKAVAHRVTVPSSEGAIEYIVKDIEEKYGYMLENGATTFWETIGGSADFDGAGSLCHGWSALPVYWLNELVK